MAGAKKKTAKSNGTGTQIKLKDIDSPTTFVLVDFGDVYEHEEFGRSVPLELEQDGREMYMWLNEKTRAGKVFFEAMENGEIDTPCKLTFRPRAFTSDKDGKEYTTVRLLIGRKVPREGAEAAPF